MRGGGGLRSKGSKPGGKRIQTRVGGGFRNQFKKRNTRQKKQPRTTTNVRDGSSGSDAYRADGARKRAHNVNRNSTVQLKKELDDENAKAYIQAAKALMDCSWMDNIKDEDIILAGRALLAKVEPAVKLKPLTLTRVRKLVRRGSNDVAIAACFVAALCESNTEAVESHLLTQTGSQERKILVLYTLGEMLKDLEKMEDLLLCVLMWSATKLIIAKDETISLLSDDQILELQRCMTKAAIKAQDVEVAKLVCLATLKSIEKASLEVQAIEGMKTLARLQKGGLGKAFHIGIIQCTYRWCCRLLDQREIKNLSPPGPLHMGILKGFGVVIDGSTPEGQMFCQACLLLLAVKVEEVEREGSASSTRNLVMHLQTFPLIAELACSIVAARPDIQHVGWLIPQAVRILERSMALKYGDGDLLQLIPYVRAAQSLALRSKAFIPTVRWLWDIFSGCAAAMARDGGEKTTTIPDLEFFILCLQLSLPELTTTADQCDMYEIAMSEALHLLAQDVQSSRGPSFPEYVYHVAKRGQAVIDSLPKAASHWRAKVRSHTTQWLQEAKATEVKRSHDGLKSL